MAIPTYEIGGIDGITILLKSKDASLVTELDPATTMQVRDGDRLYCRPSFDGNSSPMYGPGSCTYEIVAFGTDNDDHMISPAPRSPKTYIDNYGYIHIDPSNATTPEMDDLGSWYYMSVKPTYHYIDPSTGDNVAVDLGEDVLLNLKTYVVDTTVDAQANENMRAIPYNYMPELGFNLN